MVNSIGYTQGYYQEKQDIKSRKIRESLKIKKSKYYSSKLNINRDDANLMKTNTWTPLLRNIYNLESVLPIKKPL